MTESPDWTDELIEAARADGYLACRDEADSVLLAEARHLCPPGSPPDRIAEALAADLEEKSAGPVTRATCAALARAAANLRGLLLMDYSGHEALGILSVAAAKLEMRAKP